MSTLPVQRFRWTSSRLGGWLQLSANAYFVDGLLIDTGPSRLQRQVLADLKELPIEQIAVTHHHEDHTGNLAALRQCHSCPSYGHARCAQILAAPPSISVPEYLLWGPHHAVQNLGIIGDYLETERYVFEVYYTPGHADDHICLYEPNEGWLFSGDLYVHHTIQYFVVNEQMADQIRSLRAMLDLDFEYFFCGHSLHQTGGKARFQQKLQYFESFVQQAWHWHDQGYPPNQILQRMDIPERWFVRLSSRGWLSALNMVHSALRERPEEVNANRVY